MCLSSISSYHPVICHQLLRKLTKTHIEVSQIRGRALSLTLWLLYVIFYIIFDFEVLLAFLHSPKLDDYPLSFGRFGLFYRAQLPALSESLLLHTQPQEATCRGDRDTWNLADCFGQEGSDRAELQEDCGGGGFVTKSFIICILYVRVFEARKVESVGMWQCE
jgi:hypothetical protein